MNKAQRDALCEYITASIIDNEEGLIVPEMVRSLFGKELGEGSEVDGVIDFFNEGALIVVESEDDLPRVELDESNDPDRNKLYYCESEESFWLFDAEAGDIVKLNVGSRLMVDTTYSELKHMRDNGQLKPGCRYRITDYVTKANIPIQRAYNYENYLYHLAFSAEHPFDIIVLATDTDKVSDDAKAAPHNGDNYFADSNLDAWDIKYSLDNNLKYSWILDMNAVHLEITGPYEFSVITTKADGQSPDYHNITEVIEYNPSYEALTTDVPAWLNEQIAWFNDMAVQQGSPMTITLGSSYLITPQRPTDYAMVIADNPFTRDTTQVVYFNRMSILTIEMNGSRIDMPVVYDYDNDSVWDFHEGGLDIYLGVTFGMEWSVMDANGNQYVYELPEPKEEATYVSDCKGVIYYMKDEFGNECNYDFKNILYCEDYSMQSSYMDLYLDYTFNKFEGDYNGKSAPKKTVSGRRGGIDAKTVLADTLSKVLDSLKSNAKNGTKASEELEVNVYMFYDASLNDYSTDYYASHHDIEHIPSVVSGNKVFGECGFNDEYGMYMEYLPNISMSSMWGGHITNNSITLTTENGVVFFSCYDFRDNKLSAPSIHSTFINCECCGAIYNQGDSIQSQMDGQPGQYGDDEWHQGDYRALNNRPSAQITFEDSDGNELGDFNIGDDTQSNQTITIPTFSGEFPSDWRTPTQYEWDYVFNSRQASTVGGVSNARYAKAQVNGVNGLILLPDTFTLPDGVAMSSINAQNASFDSNTYTSSVWETLENAGCIFLPTDGRRSGTTVSNVGEIGEYACSTHNGSNLAYSMSIQNGYVGLVTMPFSTGICVRMIKENTSNGAFSLSSTLKGDIAKSNLQYHCLNREWRFATNAYDAVGSANANISQSYNGWIDLFGYGTSGWDSGATCYQPYSSTSNDTQYLNENLTGNHANADWGVYNFKRTLHTVAFTGDYNDLENKPAIPTAQIQADWSQSDSTALDYIKNKPDVALRSDVDALQENVDDLNDGLFSGGWRTLTRSEWEYLINTRSASTVGVTSNARYAKAQINGVVGLILLPDVFELPSGITMTNINSTGAAFSDNTYTTVEWESLEDAGCVFMPATGWRSNTSVLELTKGWYWLSTSEGADVAYFMSFYDINVTTGAGNIAIGGSVRLLRENDTGGAFSLSASTKGDIAKSNLQFHCLDKRWRFAVNAYDVIGSGNANISESYNGWIDLFGFGTSGWNSGATAYQPWSVSTTPTDYIRHSLTGDYRKADWGYNVKKHLHDIAFTGDYNDLENIPAPSANMIETTWSALVALRDGGNLVKGAFYRITDYNFVTTKLNVQSGNHPFDLVVMAISENMVSENASVCRHTGDTYFMREITVGGINWLYTMYVDSLGSAYDTGAMDHSEDMHSSDVFCDSGELVHPVTGNTVPVLYKTDSNDYGTDEPDYADAFYYEGTYNLDGDDYDMWSKYEYDDDNDEWVFAEQYALTPIVVEDGELVVSPIPETVTVPVNMNSWEVKYCLDNDTSLFDWATSGGKGVIYYMKDDFGNEAPYDFKNAMFKRYIISSVDDSILNNFVGAYLGQESYWKIVCGSNSQFFYTFSDNADDTIDASLSGTCNYNTIRPRIVDGKRVLNDIVLYNAVNNYIDTMCFNITISGSCVNNRIGSSASDWLLYGCSNNEIGIQSHENTFYTFSANKVGNNFANNHGAYTDNNTFATMCQSNNFGSNLDGSSFGFGCRQLTFGSWCLSNTFGPSVMSSTFGNYFRYNTIEGWNSSIFFPNYSRYNTIEKGCNSITINTSGGGNYSYVQYVKICKGVSNQTLAPTRNLTYETIYYKTGRDEHGVN